MLLFLFLLLLFFFFFLTGAEKSYFIIPFPIQNPNKLHRTRIIRIPKNIDGDPKTYSIFARDMSHARRKPIGGEKSLSLCPKRVCIDCPRSRPIWQSKLKRLADTMVIVILLLLVLPSYPQMLVTSLLGWWYLDRNLSR